jgi:hypothetical protein
VNFLRQLFTPGTWQLGASNTQIAPAPYAGFVDENNLNDHAFYSKTDAELSSQLIYVQKAKMPGGDLSFSANLSIAASVLHTSLC